MLNPQLYMICHCHWYMIESSQEAELRGFFDDLLLLVRLKGNFNMKKRQFKIILLVFVGVILIVSAWFFFADRYEKGIVGTENAEKDPFNSIPKEYEIKVKEDAPLFESGSYDEDSPRQFTVNKIDTISAGQGDWSFCKPRNGLMSSLFTPIDLEASSEDELAQLFFDMDKDPDKYQVTAVCERIYRDVPRYYVFSLNGDLKGEVVTYSVAGDNVFAIPVEWTDLKETIDRNKFSFPIVGKALAVGALYVVAVFAGQKLLERKKNH